MLGRARVECAVVPTMSARSAFVTLMEVLALIAVTVAAVLAPTAVDAAACWPSPVVGEVVDPFREPACAWCPGNRGLEYRVGHSATVSAVDDGEVVFAELVAGRRYVVVESSEGWLVTYGDLTDATVRTGDRVAEGVAVGAASETFHFGLRIEGRYVDPAPYLGVDSYRRRLVPLDGTAARPAPPAVRRCADDRPSVRRSHLERPGGPFLSAR